MSMTREKAIVILRMSEQAKWRSGVSVAEEKEAIDMAITALKEETICPILSDDEVKQPCIKGPCEIERPHGKWLVSYECPNCGEIRNTPFEVCPQCKADMRRR